MRPLVLAFLIAPGAAFAGDLTIEGAMIPVAPPGAQVHAGYMELTNGGADPVALVGASAQGYGMAHIHRSELVDDVATMVAVDMVEIAPGQTVVFEHGGLHLMLMRPEGTRAAGDMVSITLEFSDGTTQDVTAMVMPRTQPGQSGHQDHHGHGAHGS